MLFFKKKKVEKTEERDVIECLMEMVEKETPKNGKVHLLVKDYSLQARCKEEKERLRQHGFIVGEESFYYPERSSEDILLHVFYSC